MIASDSRLDSSVLVAALIEKHEHLRRAVIWLEAASSGRMKGIASWHAVTEVYAVLTRLPLVPRPSPSQVEEVVLRLKETLTLKEPTPAIYRAALRRAAENTIRSGGIFDAIHLVTAERAGVELLLTFNLADFRRVAHPESPRIAAPPDPPSLHVP